MTVAAVAAVVVVLAALAWLAHLFRRAVADLARDLDRLNPTSTKENQP